MRLQWIIGMSEDYEIKLLDIFIYYRICLCTTTDG